MPPVVVLWVTPYAAHGRPTHLRQYLCRSKYIRCFLLGVTTEPSNYGGNFLIGALSSVAHLLMHSGSETLLVDVLNGTLNILRDNVAQTANCALGNGRRSLLYGRWIAVSITFDPVSQTLLRGAINLSMYHD